MRKKVTGISKVILFVLITLFCDSESYADLDGRFGPTIFVQNTYTFTPNERALGFVEFEKGFDIPANGQGHLMKKLLHKAS